MATIDQLRNSYVWAVALVVLLPLLWEGSRTGWPSARMILHDAPPRLVCVDEKLDHKTQYNTDLNLDLYESS